MRACCTSTGAPLPQQGGRRLALPPSKPFARADRSSGSPQIATRLPALRTAPCARLSRLWERVTRGDLDRTATLGGCVIRPGRAARAGQIDIARENAAIAPALAVTGPEMSWDGRFRVRADAPGTSGLCIDALGRAGARHPDGAGHPDYARLAPDVRAGLPALYRNGELAARPCFSATAQAPETCRIRFAPRKPLAGAAFGNV